MGTRKKDHFADAQRASQRGKHDSRHSQGERATTKAPMRWCEGLEEETSWVGPEPLVGFDLELDPTDPQPVLAHLLANVAPKLLVIFYDMGPAFMFLPLLATPPRRCRSLSGCALSWTASTARRSRLSKRLVRTTTLYSEHFEIT